MCDYSLYKVRSRPAKVGDELVTGVFYGTNTHGFSAIGDPNTAVCLKPGTEIAFDQEVSTLDGMKLGRVAIFRQVDKHIPNTFHDALEFVVGSRVMIVKLGVFAPGWRASVLQLPLAPATPEEAAEQERVPVLA